MYFQPNAWMDRNVMAKNFNKNIRKKWGGHEVLLTCDNLDAYCCENTRKVMAKDGLVFVLAVVRCCYCCRGCCYILFRSDTGEYP